MAFVLFNPTQAIQQMVFHSDFRLVDVVLLREGLCLFLYCGKPVEAGIELFDI